MTNETDSDKDVLKKAVLQIFVLCVINVKLVFLYIVSNYFTLVLTNFFSQKSSVRVYYLITFFLYFFVSNYIIFEYNLSHFCTVFRGIFTDINEDE